MYRESSEDSDDANHANYMKASESGVFLRSPTFGHSMRIKNCPDVKLASSAGALNDLKHIESQIMGLYEMPDFGYGEDNYLIQEK
mgnify:CR=1 FL=1